MYIIKNIEADDFLGELIIRPNNDHKSVVASDDLGSTQSNFWKLFIPLT